MESADNPLCKDVNDVVSNAINNCTVLQVQNFGSFNQVSYMLFQLSFNQPVDEVNIYTFGSLYIHDLYYQE
jgi:hypothetical protein